MIRHLLFSLTACLRAKVVHADTPDPVTGTLDRDYQTPLFERYVLARGEAGGAVYLHHYLRSDPDRGLHDHPWPWAIAIPLCGGYTEERLVSFDQHGPVSVMIRRPPFLPYFLTGRDFHRLHLEPGKTSWSLFVNGPRVKLWGFLRFVGMSRVKTMGFAHFPYRDVVEGGDEWIATAPRGRDIQRAAP